MGPLKGVRVVDMSQVISGPFAATWLADQGADVVKVEDVKGDPARTIGPRKDDMSAMFFSVNRGKRGLIADLKSDEGKAKVWAEIEQADVLVQNFRPGVADRLGFGYEAVSARRPQIVYCSISGFGSSGPRSELRAYDAIVQAVAGFAACQAGASGEPELVRSYVCDKVTALTAAQAITAALFARERNGKGQHVEVAMFDTALAFIWPEGMWNHAFMDEPPPPSPEVSAGYRLWQTRDGYMSIGGLQQVEFRNMCRALGADGLADDPRFANVALRMANRNVLRELLEEKVRGWGTAELDARMAEEDAPGARVNSREALLNDPQALHNGSYVAIDAGDLGHVRGPRHPARFSSTPVSPRPHPAPRLKKG
ncbi:MAG: CoA transferase [Hyphomicrobiales bacterium]|nr:CoA transferase [Hyphomicrobiales bacterium]